ncbi:hypothetical protein L9F63_004913 [Diploptera punctata]|uniref:C2H2-type domain-containing protein n=1 Tax=Diploptera punctata TaxID=6984 RepID=A0AAD7ZDS3_DIPPU|nr:hypothetical protein L9F63_004913 [Diploptera punctata]
MLTHTDQATFFMNHFANIMDVSNSTRFSDLLKTLRSLEERIPKISLHKIDIICPLLQDSLSAKLVEKLLDKHQFCAACREEFVKDLPSENTNKTHGVLTSRTNNVTGHEEKTPVCQICSETFTTYVDLNLHQKTHNKEINLLNGSSSGNVNGINTSNEENSKIYKCSICSKIYKRASHLNQHKLEVHSGEKPFKCSICSEIFKRASHLKRHMLSHSDEKINICSICSTILKNKSDLILHNCLDSGSRPYKCNVCMKTFKQSQLMNRHKLEVHFGERPFKCLICSKAFKRLCALKQHKLTHSKEKEFKCLCSKSFKTRHELNQHHLI